MIDFPAPKMVETNGITMAVYEAGEKQDGKPPIIMCHGWPEIAYSWRHQLKAVSDAGYHVLAPDMRGYGKTDRPHAVEEYDMDHLTGDLVGLLDAYGYDKGIFCGHDWGGFVVWQMGVMHPGRVAGVIGVNTPFSDRFPMDPIELMRAGFGDDFYICWFQKEGEAEAAFEEDVARSLRFMYRKTQITLEEYDAQPAERKTVALGLGLKQPEEEWSAPLVLNDEEFAVYETAYKESGFRGGINWYRNFTRNWEKSEGVPQVVNAPSLMISAADDVVLPPRATEGMEDRVADLEKHIIDKCGHWTQSEQPDELNRIIIDWLQRRFS